MKGWKKEKKSIDEISFGYHCQCWRMQDHNAFQALDAAKSGNFDEAEELLKKSEEASTLAHKAQTDLLFDEVNGNPTPVNVLLVHSQDHLMTSMLATELIKELIIMYKKEAK